MENAAPQTVQDHIELYRKQKAMPQRQHDDLPPEEQLNFFQDMTPKITRQTKVLLVNKDRNSTAEGDSNASPTSRLNFVGDLATNMVRPVRGC